MSQHLKCTNVCLCLAECVCKLLPGKGAGESLACAGKKGKKKPKTQLTACCYVNALVVGLVIKTFSLKLY